MKRSDCLAFLVGALLVVGCDSLWESPPKPVPPAPPTPVVVVETDAKACLEEYGRRLADTFEASAAAFEKREPPMSVIKQMADDQQAARINAFMPLMKKLNEFNGRPDADAARSKQLREWAKQLRGEE